MMPIIKALVVMLMSSVLLGAGPVMDKKGMPSAVTADVKKVTKGTKKGTQYAMDAAFVRIVSLKAGQKSNGRWFWGVTLKNHHKENTIAKNRLELRAYQVKGSPNQTSPAGTYLVDYAMPPEQGLNTTHYLWDRHKKTRQIRVELWDTKYNSKIHTKRFSLPTEKDKVSKPNPMGSATAQETQQAVENIKKEIEIVGSKYRGRGRWLLRIKNIGSYTTRKGDYKYYWRYVLKDSTFPSGERWLPGVDMPSLLYKKTTSVEGEGLYTQNQNDCLVKAIEFKIIDPLNQKVTKHTIDVPAPDLSVGVGFTARTGPQSVISAARKNFNATLSLKNNSSYGYRARVYYEIFGYKASNRNCTGDIRKRKTGNFIISVAGGQSRSYMLMENVQDMIMGTYDTNAYYGYNSSIKITARAVLESSDLCGSPINIGSAENCKFGVWYEGRGAIDSGKEVIKDGINKVKEIF